MIRSQKIQQVEPIISIKSNYYKVCSLNFNMDNTEFFYHFAYSKHSKNKIWYYNLQKEMGRPDHISFHKDGYIHLSLKDDSIKISRNKMSNSNFIPNNNNTITPLLIHSIYPINEQYILPFINNKEISDNQKINTLNWTKHRPFSVIIFLTPEKLHQNDFLNTFEFHTHNGKISAKLLGYSAGRILAWDRWAIDYVLTDLTLPLNIAHNKFYCAFAFTDLNLALKDLIIQRINQ